MNRMMVMAVIGIVAGCNTDQPCRGFLNKDYRPWQEYLEQTIDVDVADRPIGEVLVAPLFPDFNCIIDLAGRPAGPPRVTMHAKGISRREALWRIARQCNVRITDDGNVVLIMPEDGKAEPTHGGGRVTSRQSPIQTR